MSRQRKDPQLLKLGRAMRRFTREADEALLHVGDLPPGEAFWLAGSVRRALQTTEAVSRWIETGETP